MIDIKDNHHDLLSATHELCGGTHGRKKPQVLCFSGTNQSTGAAQAQTIDLRIPWHVFPAAL